MLIQDDIQCSILKHLVVLNNYPSWDRVMILAGVENFVLINVEL